MLRIRLCHKLSFKFQSFRVFAPSSSTDSAPNSVRSLSFPTVAQQRINSNESVQQLIDVPSDGMSGEKLYNGIGFSVQSITPFPFDDTLMVQGNQTSTTHVHVLEQWKHLLDRLKAIVDSFHCARTTVQDLTDVRQALERHHLVKFLVKPYSYTADDVIDVGEPSCGPWDSNVYMKQIDILLPRIDSLFGEKSKSSGIENNAFASCISHLDVQHSFISQLEEESLRAASMLSSGAWKEQLENVSTQCDVFDLKWTNCTASALSGMSNVQLCQMTEYNAEGSSDEPNSKNRNRPNRDQLFAVQNYMAENLPKIFVKFHSYDVYTNDVIFENNWYLDQSYVTVGATAYALEIAKLRLFVHLRYANVKMQLLKITTNESEGTVQVRWRIMGIPQVQAIMFWKFLPWASRSSTAVSSEWLDGFSTFFVDGSGLIYKHKMDRVIPDEGPELRKQTVIEKITTTIAVPVATVTA